MEKIASFHRVADKSLDLISKIAYMTDSVRSLITNCDQESLDNIAKDAEMLQIKIEEYKNVLVTSIESISIEKEDEEKISAIKNEEGFNL